MKLFIAKDGKKTGPFSEDQVRAMIDGGIITPDEMCWHEGLSSFIPLSQIEGFNETDFPLMPASTFWSDFKIGWLGKDDKHVKDLPPVSGRFSLGYIVGKIFIIVAMCLGFVVGIPIFIIAITWPFLLIFGVPYLFFGKPVLLVAWTIISWSIKFSICFPLLAISGLIPFSVADSISSQWSLGSRNVVFFVTSIVSAFAVYGTWLFIDWLANLLIVLLHFLVPST